MLKSEPAPPKRKNRAQPHF